MAASGYYVDLGEFGLVKLLTLLKSIRLLPSQQILLEEMDERFATLQAHGYENLQQLQSAMKTKPAVQSLADETGLPLAYLTVLRREVNSYRPKPIKLADFPDVDGQAVDKLAQRKIKNTLQLLPHVLNPSARQQLARENHLEPGTVLELTKLTDVARLKWVGPKFARLLIESEYDTVAAVAKSDPDTLYAALERVNDEKNIYKGSLGVEDLRLWVTVVVQLVPQVIRY